MKRCPFCAEEIQDAAVVCRYCNRELTTLPAQAPVPASPVRMSRTAKTLVTFLIAVIGIVWVLNAVTDRGKSGTTPSGPSAPPMKFFVTTNLDGVQITNETDATWDQCHLEIAGGYTATIPLIGPKRTMTVSYTDFVRNNQVVPRGEGRLRARHLDVSCAGEDYNRHHAVYETP